MDIGDIAYFLFVIVSIILGALGRKRKKTTTKAKSKSNTSNTEVDWESLLGNFEADKEDEIEDEIVQRSFTFEKIPLKEPKKEEKQPLDKTELQNSESPKPNVIFEIDDYEAESEIDLRKAIIYSEILRRPEY